MKIAAVETLRLAEFPNLIWVVIEDDQGRRGLGETFFGAAEVQTWVHETAAPQLLGMPSRAIEAIRLKLRPYVGHQSPGAEIRGRSAIDIALWDLLGQQTGLPICDLLGGRVRDSIRTYNTCAGYQYVRATAGQHSTNWGLPGEAAAGPYEDLQGFLTDAGAVAESLLSQGITAMKIWPFDRYAEQSQGYHISAAQLDEGSEPFRQIRAAVGEQMQIMLECHSLWSASAARDIAHAMKPFNLYWIEDPIKANGFAALAQLRRQIDIKVTASETIATREQFADLIQSAGTDIVMLDLGWCGGITEAKAVAGIAEANHLPIAPHDCTGPVVWTASCHLSMNAPNALIQESVRAFYTGWYRELVDQLPAVRMGEISLPEGPGLGVSLKPELRTRADASHQISA
ncbi:MAG: mandelate racemase/muconate lactonizing enzyme family protein [Burkholderiaceae bacterium]